MSTNTPQPSSPSPALMTTTTMTPEQLYKGGNLNAQYDPSAYNNAQSYLNSYGQLRDQYVGLINAALKEEDSDKRNAMMPQINSLNQQLVALVNNIQSIYNQGQSVLSAQTNTDIQGAIDRYKQQLEELQTDEDELVKLTRLYKDMQDQTIIPQTTYTIWILGIVILLIIVLILFIRSMFTQTETFVPTLPQAPTFTLPTSESINSSIQSLGASIQSSLDSLKASLGLGQTEPSIV